MMVPSEAEVMQMRPGKMRVKRAVGSLIIRTGNQDL